MTKIPNDDERCDRIQIPRGLRVDSALGLNSMERPRGVGLGLLPPKSHRGSSQKTATDRGQGAWAIDPKLHWRARTGEEGAWRGGRCQEAKQAKHEIGRQKRAKPDLNTEGLDSHLMRVRGGTPSYQNGHLVVVLCATLGTCNRCTEYLRTRGGCVHRASGLFPVDELQQTSISQQCSDAVR